MSTVFLSYLKNILYREPSFVLRYYLHYGKKDENMPDDVFMADGKMLHGGLFDRLKGAVSIYAISKVKGKQFGIYFVNPFKLEKYLNPNLYDWRVCDEKMVYSFPSSRPIVAYSEFKNPRRLFKNRNGQTHYYFGSNIVELVNQKYGTSYDWVMLYKELFTPSEYLKHHVDQVKADAGSSYFAIHLRFMNLLGDRIENNQDSTLNEAERQELMNVCVEKIKRLAISIKLRPIVFTDSMVFLQEVKKELPEAYIVSGNARHIGTAGKTTDDENLKLFTDMYLMVDAQKVYSIVGKGLYSSAFPEYSAMIGSKPFERVKL